MFSGTASLALFLACSFFLPKSSLLFLKNCSYIVKSVIRSILKGKYFHYFCCGSIKHGSKKIQQIKNSSASLIETNNNLNFSLIRSNFCIVSNFSFANQWTGFYMITAFIMKELK